MARPARRFLIVKFCSLSGKPSLKIATLTTLKALSVRSFKQKAPYKFVRQTLQPLSCRGVFFDTDERDDRNN